MFSLPTQRLHTVAVMTGMVILWLLMPISGRAQSMPGMAMMPGMSMTHEARPCQSAQPLGCADTATPAFAPDGTLLLTWTQDKKIYVARSRDLGRSWSLPDQVGDASSGFDGGGDARPQLIADGAGHVLIAYDTFKDHNWNAHIWLVSSSDGGVHFDAPRVFEPGAVSQRLPVLDVTASGKILMVWQDKRLSGPKNLPGASIAYAWSTDSGRTFSPSALAADVSCECCRIAVTNTPRGLPILAFRTIFPGQVRDHVILPFLSSGVPGPQQRVSVDDWVINACPHHGPSIAVSDDGTVHVAWYTQGKARQGVFYANAQRGVSAFGEPQLLGNPDDVTSRPYVFAQGSQVWRAWKVFDGHVSRVMVQRSHDDGHHWGPASILGRSAGHSDHPLLIGHKNRVFLSWLNSERGYQLTDITRLK